MEIWLSIFFEAGSCYVAQAGLDLTILLPQPPDLGLQICTTTISSVFIFGSALPRALHTLGKHSTTELHLQPSNILWLYYSLITLQSCLIQTI
jgi:hypothetical protein